MSLPLCHMLHLCALSGALIIANTPTPNALLFPAPLTTVQLYSCEMERYPLAARTGGSKPTSNTCAPLLPFQCSRAAALHDRADHIFLGPAACTGGSNHGHVPQCERQLLAYLCFPTSLLLCSPLGLSAFTAAVPSSPVLFNCSHLCYALQLKSIG